MYTSAGCERMGRGGEQPAKERAMISRKKKHSREYTANPAGNAQYHDSMEFIALSSTKVSRSYEARFMMESLSVRSIHC